MLPYQRKWDERNHGIELNSLFQGLRDPNGIMENVILQCYHKLYVLKISLLIKYKNKPTIWKDNLTRQYFHI